MQQLISFPRSKRLMLMIVVITGVDKACDLFHKMFHCDYDENTQLHPHPFINQLKMAFYTEPMTQQNLKNILLDVGQFVMIMVTLFILCFLFGYS